MVIKRIMKPKVKAIKLSDYFALQNNRMVTFRITPHASVSNASNAKLWRVLHKMYEIYDAVPARISKDGFRFTYREKDAIWIDVVFRQVGGKKSVEFYASTSEIWAKKFREMLENYMRVTIEEVSAELLTVPSERNLSLYDVRLARHDIFALHTDAREQTSPISSILTALNDISEDGDFARLSVCAETYSRAKWSRNAAWAYEKVQKGNVPQRAKLTASKVQRALKGGTTTLLNEIYDVLTDTMEAISRTFFKSDKGYEKKAVISKRDGLLEELNARHESKRSAAKLSAPVWKARIKVASATESKIRGDLVANTITSAFSEIAGDNELVPFKIRMKARKEEALGELNSLHLSQRSKADGDVSLLSCEELGKVALMLPVASVQQKYEEELAVKRQVETDLPKELYHSEGKQYVNIDGIQISIGSNNVKYQSKKKRLINRKESGILVGHAEVRGKEYAIGLPTKNLDETFRSYGFVGAPRMGKDTLMKNMVAEACLKHGYATFVLDAIMEDGERGFADGIRDTLPPDKVIDIDLSDTEYPVPLDLTELVEKLGSNGVNRFAQELIDFFGDVESMGQSRSILREFAKASGGSIIEIKRLLEDESLRIMRANELREQGNMRTAQFLAKYVSEYGEDAKGNPKVVRDGQKALDGKAGAILNRLDEMIGDDVLYRIFAQAPKEEINFERWIREGKVVIFRVPNRKLGALAVKTLMHWLTLKIFMTKLLMNPADGQAFIVFNEPHQYLTPGLKSLMQRIILEGPKWRISGLFAFHHFELLKYGLDDDLISGGINWFLFANDNRKVFEKLSAQLAPTFDVDAALATEAYHAVTIARFGGRRLNAFLLRALPPTSARLPQYDNSFLTRRHSRLYGRHWRDVEALSS